MKSFRNVFACGTPDAAESLRLGERSVETLQPVFRRRAFLDIVSLATCLVGFIGLIFVVWRMKTGVFGTPRALYLLFIGMACAPFYVAFVRPPKIGYLWIEPVLRLLAIPATVYSFGRRLFGPRTAAIGLLLYLGTPSILFNDAVQQGFGTIFFALSLLALFLLVQAVHPSAQRR